MAGYGFEKNLALEWAWLGGDRISTKLSWLERTVTGQSQLAFTVPSPPSCVGHSSGQDLPARLTGSMKPALLLQLLLLTRLAPQLVSGSPKQHFTSSIHISCQ
ncbi:WAP four-disulfide core domain protein 13 isoform X2 [Sus scrofa]|uniref:WAP four-disulfide core domain protein 13 isoform X2 n=1 Tax=Sus scrofa TaxID=9823 RepID=UPI000A2B8A90|nr:WAP four-disulfide core domain protein 13 isoform X2 [Sus scrofa]